MKTLVRLILAFLLGCALALPLTAQAPLCPFTTTATGGGYYRVLTGVDSLVSQHTRLDKALERASREASAGAADVRVLHDFELRVECPSGWELPPPDSLTVEPADFALAVGDTLQLTALIWYRGLVMGCAGRGGESWWDYGRPCPRGGG